MDITSKRELLDMIGNFRYNCTRCQLINEKRGELHKIKQSRDKTKK